MISYSRKDVERVRRAAGVSAAQARSLLRQYGGRADRVMEEQFGAVRVYVDPVSVREPYEGVRRALGGAAQFCRRARLRISRRGQTLAVFPLLPALLIAVLTAPASILLALCALFMSCRFSVCSAGGGADECFTLI